MIIRIERFEANFGQDTDTRYALASRLCSVLVPDLHMISRLEPAGMVLNYRQV
jgi:hypothetical protein